MSAQDSRASEVRRPGFLSAAIQTYGAQIGVAFLSLGNVLIVSRALGPSGRGEFAFITAIAYLTSSVAMFGIQEANVNLASAGSRVRRSLATNSVVFAVLLGCAGIVAVAILVAFAPGVVEGADRMLLWLALGCLPLLILNVYLSFLLQGTYGFSVTNLAWFLTAVINLCVNGTLAALGVLSVGSALATWLGGQAVATGLQIWYVARRSSGFGRPRLDLARRSLGFGARSHPGRIMLLANYRLDVWILGALAGVHEVGLYSVAVALAEALFLLPTALSAVQRPDLVRASPADAVRLASRIFRASALLTGLSAVALVVTAPIFVRLLFGENFAGSVDDLRVLVAGAFGIVALKQLGSALTARGRPTLTSIATGVAFASTIALDLLLIPDHGGLGAAIASTVSYTLGGAVVLLVFAHSLGGRPSDLIPRADDLRALWAARPARVRARD
jgi:O-antigen/teichoic acid export membrane protein